MEQWKKAPYAFIGTYDLAYEKARTAFGKAQTLGRKATRTDYTEVYGDLAKRGERLMNRIQRSKPAKRASDGTRQASRQLKGAYTSIRKAVGLEEQRKTTRKAS